MSSKTLLSSSSLRDILGAGSSKRDGGKKKLSRTTSSLEPIEDADSIIRSILLEETGTASRPRNLPRRRRNNRKYEDMSNLSLVSGLETAKLARRTSNSVHVFASSLGLPREDIAHVELQYRHIRKIMLATKEALLSGYEELCPSDEPESFTYEKALLLSRFSGVDCGEDDIAKICLTAGKLKQEKQAEVSSSSMNIATDLDNFIINFDVWLPALMSLQRKRLIMGILEEKRLGSPARFLDSQVLPENRSIHDFRPDDDYDMNGPSMLESPSVAHTYTSNDLFEGFGSFDDTGPGFHTSMYSKTSASNLNKSSMFQNSFTSGLTLPKIKSLPAMKRRGSKSTAPLPRKYKSNSASDLESVFDTGSQITTNSNNPMDIVETLRKQLEDAKAGLAQMTNLVDENIAWIHTNCDTSNTVGISRVGRDKCRRIAINRLFVVFETLLKRSIFLSFQQWAKVCVSEKLSSITRSFSLVKGIEGLSNTLGDILARRLYLGWKPWFLYARAQKNFERDIIVVEIQRVARGMLARFAIKDGIIRKAVIKIQCMVRKRLARKRAAKVRLVRQMALKKASKKRKVKKRQTSPPRSASSEVKHVRAQNAAIKIQKLHRGRVGRQRFLLKKQDHSVMLIQKIVRGKLARSRVTNIREEVAKKKKKENKFSLIGELLNPFAPAIKKEPDPARLTTSSFMQSLPGLGSFGFRQSISATDSQQQGSPSATTAVSTEDPRPTTSSFIQSLSGIGSSLGSFGLRQSMSTTNSQEQGSPSATIPVSIEPKTEADSANSVISPSSNSKEVAKPTEETVSRQKPITAQPSSTFKEVVDKEKSNTTTKTTSQPSGGGGSKQRPSTVSTEAVKPVEKLGSDQKPKTAQASSNSKENAEKEAVATRAKAEKEAADSKARAKKEAAELKTKAQREAAETKAKVDKELEEAREKVEREAAEARAKAEREAQELMNQSQKLLAETKDRTEREAIEVKEAILREASEAKLRTEREALEAQAQAQMLIAQEKAKAEREIAELRAKAQKEIADAKALADKQAAEARMKSEEDSAAAVAMSQKMISDAKSQAERELAEAARIRASMEAEESKRIEAMRRDSEKTRNKLDPGPPPERPNTAGGPGVLSKFGSFFGSFTAGSRPTTAAVDAPKKPQIEPNCTKEEAVQRIQRLMRCGVAIKKLNKRRDLEITAQDKAAMLVTWAAIKIQSRIARGPIGRVKMYKQRLLKEGDAVEKKRKAAVVIQCLFRKTIARRRVKELFKARKEEQKMKDLEKYRKTGKAPGSIAAGKINKAADFDDDSSIGSHVPGMTEHQAREIQEKLDRLEAIEKSIAEREERMREAARLSEERAFAMEKALREFEARAKAEEAERAAREQMFALAAGPIPSSGRSIMGSSGPGRYSARDNSARSPRVKRDSIDPPPSARSARDVAGIPADALKIKYEGQTWVQLWDPDENYHYWYCPKTKHAQWEKPGEPVANSGYDSSGAMTDYSTDWYESGGEHTDSESASEWQEYYDDAAQAKYWYNAVTGEATWTQPDKPRSRSNSRGRLSAREVPVAAYSQPDEWVSYMDLDTQQEYWYNTRTGETSWDSR